MRDVVSRPIKVAAVAALAAVPLAVLVAGPGHTGGVTG